MALKYTKHAANKFLDLPPGSITVTREDVLSNNILPSQERKI